MKIIKCDKCKEEIQEDSNFFNLEDFESFDDSKSNLSKIEKPHLCSKCVKGYNKIISNTNKEIRDYLKK